MNWFAAFAASGFAATGAFIAGAVASMDKRRPPLLTALFVAGAVVSFGLATGFAL